LAVGDGDGRRKPRETKDLRPPVTRNCILPLGVVVVVVVVIVVVVVVIVA